MIKKAYNWTKDKVVRVWNWTKRNTLKVLIGIGLVGVVGAATLMPKAPSDVSLERMAEKYNASQETQAKYEMKGASLVHNKIKNPELTKGGEPKDEIEITLGEENQANFVPNIKMKRWNEVWFKVKPRITADLKDQELEFEEDKIKFKTPKMEIEFEDFEDSYKMIWYLNSKPASNVVEFDIESEGLDFFYQPELTQEEIDRGHIRPENVVGSYAIYHSGNPINWTDGKLYRAGKIGHIYRPKLIDSNNWEVWGELNIENGIYSITIPDNFYNNAQYPTRANDIFGWNGEGGSSFIFGNDLLGSVFTGAAGTATKITAYTTEYQGFEAAGGLYKHSDSTLITNGQTDSHDSVTGQDWEDYDYSTEPTIEAIDYVICLGQEYAPFVELGLFYDGGDTNQGHHDSNCIDEGPPFALPATASFAHNNNKFSIYATYTPSGGAERRIIIIE